MCEGCRQERKQLLDLLQTVKATLPSPTLSHEDGRTLANSIIRRVREEREGTWLGKRLFGSPFRLIPSLAAASILVVVFGWFGLKGLRSPSSIPTISNLKVEEHILVEDLDIIENLELLEEMDVLHKLVHVVDHGDLR